MEISVGEYGRMMFEMMTGNYVLPQHWNSIKDEAKPLVYKLLALNNKMFSADGNYQIIGFKDESGKQVLSNSKRIEKAQNTWLCRGKALCEGDLVWLTDSDYDMYIGQNEPATVIDITKRGIYLDMDRTIICIRENEEVLRAPLDWGKNRILYESDEYWLQVATGLGFLA